MSKITRFSDQWLSNPLFASWLGKDVQSLQRFRCCLCGGTYELGNMGKQALFSHMRGKKHDLKVQLSVKAKKEQPTLTARHFLPLTTKSNDTVSSTSAPSTSGSKKVSQTATKNDDSHDTVDFQELRVPSPPPVEEAQSSKHATGMASFVSRDDVLTAEILWAIKTVMSHYSCSSSAHTDMLFKRMFPDSQIACRFACGETKCSYLIRFGLAPFFDKEVLA